APSARARETGRASTRAIGLFHTSVVRGDDATRNERDDVEEFEIACRGIARQRERQVTKTGNFKYRPKARYRSTKHISLRGREPLCSRREASRVCDWLRGEAHSCKPVYS